MTRRPGLDTRLARLEDCQDQANKLTLVRRIAEGAGISETELMAEMERMIGICRAPGITSGPAMSRYWADDLGITVEEIEQRMERYRELTA